HNSARSAPQKWPSGACRPSEAVTKGDEIVVVLAHCRWRRLPAPSHGPFRAISALRILATTPAQNDVRRSHSFQHRILPPNHVWLDDAKLKNAVICFPIDRNVYNKIFGGYLMRLAFELAWSNAAMYAKGRVKIVAVDDIMFRKSVEIGSFLLLSSQVCYTVGDRMELSVHAEVLNVSTGKRVTTNTFYFMFKADHDVPFIIPKSYADGMLFVNAKRHYDRSENRL
ncbi:Acyl-coenzyme A thioesterase 10, mitochondrial, partial [Toxocara canis]